MDTIGTRGGKRARREAKEAAALQALECGELERAGCSRRAISVWQMHRGGRDDHALAHLLRMNLATVRKSLERTSHQLRAYRDSRLPDLPDLPDPADYQDGRSYHRFLVQCAGSSVDEALAHPDEGRA